MRLMKTRLLASLLLLLLPSAAVSAPIDRAGLAARVRAELLHSWRAYERYAWGHDELKPLSKAPRDWYGESLLMTPVDSLDTLLLLGLNEEADKAKARRHLARYYASMDRTPPWED